MQDAIDAASDGATILVRNGAAENLVIKKNLSFLPASSGCGTADPSSVVYLTPANTTGNAPLVWIGDSLEVSFHHFNLQGGVHNGVGGNISAGAGTELTLYDSVVTSGTANHGGAVGFRGDGGQLFVASSIVSDNVATFDGGAIYAQAATLVSVQSSVIGLLGSPYGWNEAGRDGGGIFAGKDSIVTVWDQAMVRRNTATRHGGGIAGQADVWVSGNGYVRGSAGEDGGGIQGRNVYVWDSQVARGSASRGGGIFATDHVELWGNSTMEGGHAGSGGGIYSEGTVLLRDDARVRDANATQNGGCIHASALEMEGQAVVADCRAYGTEGGAVRVGDLTMRDQSALRDSAAGASVGSGSGGLAYVSGHLDLSDNVELSGGTAYRQGGLLYLGLNATGEITGNARLEDGTASLSGGLIYLLRGSSLTIGSGGGAPVLSGGTAATGGGIAAAGLSSARVTLNLQGETELLDNAAAGNGGGIWLSRADLEVSEGVQIGRPGFGNSATEGGGIYATNATIHLDGSELDYGQQTWAVPIGGVRIAANQATSRGGAIRLGNGADLFGTRLVLHSNEATGSAGQGGGLALTGTALADLQYTIVQGNHARQGGGAWLSGGTLVMQGEPSEACNPLAGGVYTPNSNRYCAEFTGNQADDGGAVANAGGAIYAENAAVVLREVGVQQNLADADATALYLGDGADGQLRNVLVAAINDTVSVSVRVAENAYLEALMSTFADLGTTVALDSGSSGFVQGSIFWPMGGAGAGLQLDPNSAAFGVCSLGAGDLLALGPNNAVGDPDFVTTARGSYRIDPTSDAYHNCPTGPVRDLDGRFRTLGFSAGSFEP